MEYIKCLLAGLILMLRLTFLSTNLQRNTTISITTTTVAPLLSPGCEKIYPTMIKVYEDQRVSLSCPVCTENWMNKSYQWQVYNCQLEPQPSKPHECWINYSGHQHINYLIEITVKFSEIFRCTVEGFFKNERIRGESGPIYLNVDTEFSLEEFCKSEYKSAAGLGVIIAIVTSVVILVIATAALLLFVFKKRITNCSRRLLSKDVIESYDDTQQETRQGPEEDDDGYILPIQHNRPDVSYIEIIPSISVASTSNNTNKTKNRKDKTKLQPHLYENIQSLSLPTGGARR